MSIEFHRDFLSLWFTSNELGHLQAKRRSIDLERATIVFASYENPFAVSGGLFAVADNYGRTIQRLGHRIVIVSPLHTRLVKTPPEERLTWLADVKVPFDGRSVDVQVFEVIHGDVRWVLFRAPGFFEASGGPGRTDPYAHDQPSQLLTDSLFAAAALPWVLQGIGLRQDLVVHLQDWEFAACALTCREAICNGVLESAVVLLTSHNPYDQHVDQAILGKITKRPGPRELLGASMYQRMLPLTDGPVSTVSVGFRDDLQKDPLQLGHFAEHLQFVLRDQGVVGIPNGLFGKPTEPFSASAVSAALNNAPAPILAEKQVKRRKMLELIESYQDPSLGCWGTLRADGGRPLSELADDVPVFMMFGRFDSGQKGFDVLANAIEYIPRGAAKFVLTPAVSGGSNKFVDQLRELTMDREGDVIVYPFRMEKGYMETMAGASYAVMPSLYEPFGAATEPFLAGTPVIARATGGLTQQVIDVCDNPAAGNGLLFLELDASPPSLLKQWKEIAMAKSPAERLKVPAYGALVFSLAVRLIRAIELVNTNQVAYAQMLARGASSAKAFSWDDTAKRYWQWYSDAVRR